MSLDKSLVDILACPACKSAVRDAGEWIVCTGASCGLAYPIREGIPVMLIEEASKNAQITSKKDAPR